jgi:hypothetical protein
MKKNLLKTLGILWLAIVLLSAASAWGQTPPRIYRNNIDTDAGTQNPYTTGEIKDANITASGIYRSSGMQYSWASHSFRGIGWNSPAFDPNDYFEWTMTPNEGYAMNFTQLNANQSHEGGQRQTSLRSSLDNFTASIAEGPNNFYDLSAAQFQNVTIPITFRLYVWKAANANNQYGVDFYTFFGTVTPALGTTGFEKSLLKYYPNPVRDIITFSNATEITGIEVYNMLGQQVLLKKTSGNDVAVNISGLTAGTYLVKVTSAEGEKVIKVLKQ